MTIVPNIAWIGREYLVNIFGFGHFLKQTNYVPIEPRQPQQARQSISRAIEHAKGGLTVAIFPEGTRTTDGKLSPFKKGFVHIMRSAQLDLLPITLNGFYSLKPKTQFCINPFAKLEIVIHPVLKYAEICDLANEEILEIARNAVGKNHRYC
jgi:1-acyl-sn-glycerol-3-phosphate acyltransferase